MTRWTGESTFYRSFGFGSGARQAKTIDAHRVSSGLPDDVLQLPSNLYTVDSAAFASITVARRVRGAIHEQFKRSCYGSGYGPKQQILGTQAFAYRNSYARSRLACLSLGLVSPWPHFLLWLR